jgi:hypothetical protein
VKIKIMSIQDLLRIPNLHNSFKDAIVFVTTNPNYYDFGYILQLNIADTDAPTITNCDLARLSYFAKRESGKFQTVYVCCDAGLSRSPAVALYIATRLDNSDTIGNIKDGYWFLNKPLFDKLMRLTK